MNAKYTKRGLGQAVAMFALLAIFGSLTISETAADERPTNPEIGSNTFELLSYQGSGYRFKVIGLGEEPPSAFEQPGFDETGFDIGNAAFGGGGGGAIGGEDCPLRATVQTPWPLESRLLVRRVVSIPPGTINLRVMVSVDNDIIGVFFNGTSLTGFISHDECPVRDEFRFDVPHSLVQPGENLMAFHVLDRPGAQGNESFFDARVLAELDPDRLLHNAMQLYQQLPPELNPTKAAACRACRTKAHIRDIGCKKDFGENQLKNCPPAPPPNETTEERVERFDKCIKFLEESSRCAIEGSLGELECESQACFTR